MLENSALLLLILISSDEASASVESYLRSLAGKFGEEEARKHASKLNWVDILHEELPDDLLYRRVELTWTTSTAQFGNVTKRKEREVKAFTKKVNNRKGATDITVTLSRTTKHTNVYSVWTLDATRMIPAKAFTAGLKGLISTAMQSHEDVSKEYEKFLDIFETETLGVSATVTISAQSMAEISWIIIEAEAEVEWTVDTAIWGSFAICLTNHTGYEHILVYSAPALKAVDSTLEVVGHDSVRRVSHGKMESLTASKSFIRIEERFPKGKKIRSTPNRDIQTQLLHSAADKPSV